MSTSSSQKKRAIYSQLEGLATEQVNRASRRIDAEDVNGILRIMVREDSKVPGAVKAELPHIAQWVLVRAGTYVTAFEPHNCPMSGRARARETGSLPFLAPGDEREYNFEVGVLANNSEIEARASQVVVS